MKPKPKKQFIMVTGGSGMESYIQNICTVCGWEGYLHYSSNNYQHGNCREERERHEKKCKEKP